MVHYKLLLANDRVGTYRAIALFILVINSIAFSFLYFTSPGIRYFSLAGAIISLTGFLLAFFLSERFVVSLIVFIVLGFIWFLVQNYFLALLLGVFAFTGIYANRKPWVIFTGEGIIYPSFPEKNIYWADVSNVILKDDIITIDLKDNTLIQKVVAREQSMKIEQVEFNNFCDKKIKDSKS